MKKILVYMFLISTILISWCWKNADYEFSMKEKCSKYFEVAIQPEIIEAWYTLLTNFDKTHHWAVYNKELNTCLAYVEWTASFWPWVWDWDEWYIRRIVVDALTNTVLVDCNAHMKWGIETERYEEYDPVLTKEQVEAFEHFKCYNQYHKYIEFQYY